MDREREGEGKREKAKGRRKGGRIEELEERWKERKV